MDRHRSRHSMAFSTPQSQRFNLSQSRRSVSILDSESSCAIETLFETLMNDPTKRDIVLKLMMQDKRKIEEIRRKQQGNLKKGGDLEPSLLNKVKHKFTCESPTALFRRRALEQPNENNPATSSCVTTPSPLPFEHLLEDVVAYVEVKSNDCDRSAGAKALMRAMGAVVKNTLSRDVTHVVFKDGSFNTYQKAKLMKIHLVSVLWLEAIRRNQTRVPERNYPALGTDLFKANLSLLCEEMQRDYEDVIRDELTRSMAVNSQNQDNSSRTPSRAGSSPTSNQSSNNLTEDVIDVSQDCDAVSIISKASRCLQKTDTTEAVPTTPDSLKLHSSPGLTSDSDSSGVGVINGHAVKKVARNLLELPNDFNIQRVSNVASNKNKEHSKDSVENASSESTSLLNTVKKSEPKRKGQRSLYNQVDVENSLFLSPAGNKQATVQLNVGADEQELIDCRGSIEDMELTRCINDDFVTKRRTRMVSRNHDFSVESTINKDGGPAKNSLIQNSSAERSSKKSTLFNSEKKSLTKTNSTQELSSLRISTDSSRTRSIITSNEGRCTADTKIVTRKSSSTQELSSLRLSVDSRTRSNLTNNQETTKQEKHPAQRTRESSSSRDTQKNKISANKNESQLRAWKRKLSGSQSRTSDETSYRTISSNSSLIQSLDNALQILNDDISPKKATHETPSKKSKQDANCKQIRSGSKENEVDHSEDESDIVIIQSLDNALQILNDDVFPKKATYKTPSKKSKQDVNCKHIRSGLKENEIDRSEIESDIGPRKATTRKSSCKTKTISRAPQHSDDSPTKEKKKVRRLYNLNYCCDEISVPWNEKAKEVKEKVPEVFKKPAPVSTAPVLLTPNALAFVEKLKHTQLTSSDGDNKTKEMPAVSQCPTRKSGRIAKRKEKVNTPVIGIMPEKNRRSTLEFTPKVIKTPAKPKGTQRLKKPGIVCTRFHRPDVQVFQQVVKKLGNFLVEDEVTERTTHLVAGESKRTINILRAIARGCWVLKSEWLYKSLEANKWLAEEDFELTEFSPAVQQCRQQQQAFGPLYSMDIFENCGPIYIARSTTPRCSDLQELVKLCKGEVTQIQRNALVVVGEFVEHDGVTCVVEKWILDSIMYNKKKTFKNYLIRAH